MKSSIKYLIIGAFLVAGGIAAGLWFGYEPAITSGATGSRFGIETQWLQASTTSVLTPTVSDTAIATTSPIYMTANSTTTVTVTTAGISDFRINLHAKSTTTAPTITIARNIVGNNGTAIQDYYPDGTFTAATGIVTDTAMLTWNKATTTNATLSDSNIPKTSFQFTNPNAPKIQLQFGSNAAVDLNVELLKITPN